jgi:PPOX class probable F420-dependent enzyme
VKQRDQVAMTGPEIAALLESAHKVQVATINPDGTPHLVTMFYVLTGGRITFWTYRTSQKARNLARDPRLACLVEDGEDYFELRGVQLTGTARCVGDQAGVLDIGRRIAGGLGGGPGAGAGGGPAGALHEYVARAARKRVGFIVDPERTVSWDHRKLRPAT